MVITEFGQFAAQRPQPVQLLFRCSILPEPGGMITGFFLTMTMPLIFVARALVVVRIEAAASVPRAIVALINPLRSLLSGVFDGSRRMVKVAALSLQELTQLKHLTHRSLSTVFATEEIHSLLQVLSQSPQEVQVSDAMCILAKEYRDKNPKSAPAGQRWLQNHLPLLMELAPMNTIIMSDTSVKEPVDGVRGRRVSL